MVYTNSKIFWYLVYRQMNSIPTFPGKLGDWLINQRYTLLTKLNQSSVMSSLLSSVMSSCLLCIFHERKSSVLLTLITIPLQHGMAAGLCVDWNKNLKSKLNVDVKTPAEPGITINLIILNRA